MSMWHMKLPVYHKLYIWSIVSNVGNIWKIQFKEKQSTWGTINKQTTYGMSK